MTTQVIFKIDKTLKAKAQKKAKMDGLSFSDILQMSTREYVQGRFEPQMVQTEEKFNTKTRRILDRVLKDVKEGKNLVGPFKTAQEMDNYLDSL